jgi:hypothetical protein
VLAGGRIDRRAGHFASGMRGSPTPAEGIIVIGGKAKAGSAAGIFGPGSASTSLRRRRTCAYGIPVLAEAAFYC